MTVTCSAVVLAVVVTVVDANSLNAAGKTSGMLGNQVVVNAATVVLGVTAVTVISWIR